MAGPTITIPSLTVEEEDHIILARITNDERPLKRVIKRFHNYLNTLSTKRAQSPTSDSIETERQEEDVREAFLVALASFQLLLKKSTMICEAEARQVGEYQKERQRIEQEHGSLKTQIRELKIALEQAQLLRRRKMEYDVVADKIHTLPSREELEQEIHALESDMADINAENENQERTIQGHKNALDGIIAELSSLRFLGREKDAVSEDPSPRATPLPESQGATTETNNVDASTRANSVITTSPSKGELEDEKLSTEPETSNIVLDDDIEMGELEEDPKERGPAKKKPMEELEEGETFDGSSELSEPPDDSDDEL